MLTLPCLVKWPPMLTWPCPMACHQIDVAARADVAVPGDLPPDQRGPPVLTWPCWVHTFATRSRWPCLVKWPPMLTWPRLVAHHQITVAVPVLACLPGGHHLPVAVGV